MELNLTGAEKEVLRETIEKAINDLLMEIAHTDNRKLREMLRDREEILKAIQGKLPAAEQAA
ncbi:MAG: hypothetical protein AB1346_00525 [Thermodesulfobacteriota bacterium]